jgi:hypothetical protein
LAEEIWEVLKATYAQVKEWLGKLLAMITDKSASLEKRAENIKRAAAKLDREKVGPVAIHAVSIYGAASKIAVGDKINISDIDKVLDFVKDAGNRNTKATAAVIKARTLLYDAVKHIKSGQPLGSAEFDQFEKQIRSTVFSTAYSDERGEAFKTLLLPGNVQFIVYSEQAWVLKVESEPVEVYAVATCLNRNELQAVSQKVLEILHAIKEAEMFDNMMQKIAVDLDPNIDASPEQMQQINKLAATVSKLIRAQSTSIGRVLRYATTTCEGYLQYAELSLKQY